MLSVKECSREAERCRLLAAKERNSEVRRSLLEEAAQWKFAGAEIARFLNTAESEVKAAARPAMRSRACHEAFA
jgi:hypothetical protein